MTQKKAGECLKQVLTYFKGDPEIPTVFLAGALSNSKILLEGSHGKGKTYVAELCSKVLNLELSIVQGSAGLTESKFLARYDIADLMKGKETVDWKNFVDADIKLFDEINRVHPSILNSIFTMLARDRLDFGDESRELKPYVFVGTMNPADSGTYNIPLPLYDRFDISILTETVSFADKLKILANHQKEIKPVLKKGEIQKIWDEVETVETPPAIDVYITTITRDLQLCVHGSKEFITNFPACCEECRYKNYICSAISNESPVSERLYLSLKRVAKGLAYLKGRKTVIQEDIDILLKYGLYHRLKFTPLYQQKHVTIGGAVNNLIAEVNKKEGERQIAYNLIADIHKNPDLTKVEELSEWGENDLLLNEIIVRVKEKAEEQAKKIEENIQNLEGKDLEELWARIEKGEVKVSPKVKEKIRKGVQKKLEIPLPKDIDALSFKAKVSRIDLKLSKDLRPKDLRKIGTKGIGEKIKVEVKKDGIWVKVKDVNDKKIVVDFLKEIGDSPPI